MSEVSNAENTLSNDQAPVLKLGEVLTEKREQKNLSIEDVSSQLRLSVKQVKALENNRFDALPEPMITRGFIRNYARLLGIDVEPLLQAHRLLSASEAPISLSIPSANIQISNRRRGTWLPYVIGILLLLIGLGLWDYLYLHSTQEPAQPDLAAVSHEDQEKASTEAKNAEKTAEKMPEPALPVEERIAEPEPAPAVPATPAVNAEPVNPAETQAPVKLAQPTEQKSASDISLEVQLNFSEQSWVSIVDGDNKEIYTKLNLAGASEKIAGKPPLKLKIGNASGTQVIYKNQSVDLSRYTKDNVARITLSLEQN